MEKIKQNAILQRQKQNEILRITEPDPLNAQLETKKLQQDLSEVNPKSKPLNFYWDSLLKEHYFDKDCDFVTLEEFQT